MSTKKACSPVTDNPKEDAFYERIDHRTMTPEQLAQIAYEAYANVGTAWRLAPWSTLTKMQKDAWTAAAKAVKANVLSNFTKVGEGERP